jgi:autotransporter-associated beta strand protein
VDVSFHNNALAYTLNSADVKGITGPQSVTLAGTNMVTFNGANTYSGNTVLGADAQLTLNGANSYAGETVLGDGAQLTLGPSGTIASSTNITLGSGSVLTLGNSGALAGALAISLGAGSVLDASPSSLSLAGTQTLSGSGTVNGNVTAASGATIIPGTLGGAGVLTFNNNLSLTAQALPFDIGFTANGAADQIVVGGALTLNGNSTISLNFPGGVLFNGTYTLMTFSSISGGTFVLDKSYPGVTLNNNATSVTLTVTGGITSGGTSGVWTNLVSGNNWTNAGNWQNGVIASGADALADFSSLLMTANEQVNINNNINIGYMVFGDAGQTYGWTLANGTNTLAVSSGLPTIIVGDGSSATISSVLAGSKGFTKQGSGTLSLNGANTITNGIRVLDGTLNVIGVNALSGTTDPTVNPVMVSNAIVQFSTTGSGAKTFNNNFVFGGASNVIAQSSSTQTILAGAFSGSGIVNISTPGTVVMAQRGDMSGFSGTLLVTGNAAGNNNGGLLMGQGDTTSWVAGSSNAVFDFEGNKLNYLYNASGQDAKVYMGALVGNNANVVLNGKNSLGSAVGNVTIVEGALNTDAAFAGVLKDYAGSTPGTPAPHLGIQKVGSGSLTLSGANLNTGLIEVQSGTLVVSGSLAASPVAVDNGATFELDGTVASPTITVNSGGSFVLGSGASLGSAAVEVNGLMDVTSSGGYFYLNSASLSGSGVVKGAVTLTTSSINPGPVGGAGALTITNGDLTLSGGSLNFDLSVDPTNIPNDQLVVNGNLTLNGQTTVNVTKLAGSLGGGTYPLIKFSGAFTGSLDSLTLMGAGPLDVLQQNGQEIDLVVSPAATVVWTGGQPGNLWDINSSVNWLSNGVPAIFTNAEVAMFDDSGATNPVVTIAETLQPAAVVVNSSSNYTFIGAADIDGASSLTKNGSGTLNILNANTYSGSTYLVGGTLQLGDGTANNGSVAGNIADNANLVVANPSDQTYAGVISGTGTLVKQGAGMLTLTATNLLTGPTTISAGTLSLGDGYSTTASLGNGNVTNNSVLLVNEINPVTISNNITGTGGIGNVASGDVILTGVLSGSCSLTNDNLAGKLTLQSSNSFTGGTFINGGTVIINDPAIQGLGTGPIIINDGRGTLQFGSPGTNVLANAVQLPSYSTTEQFTMLNVNGGFVTIRLTNVLSGGYAGQVTPMVDTGVSGNNRATLILDNPNNTFATIPEAYSGTLAFTSDGALGNSTNSISINCANHVNTAFFNRADDGLRFDADNLTLNASRTINLVGASENINVQGYNGTVAGAIAGNGLVKRGSGILTVIGPGSLTNSSTVLAGTLVLNNVWTGTSVGVSSGATLSGSGTINAGVEVASGGTLAPGNGSVALLTVNSNLVFDAGSTAQMNINAAGTTADRVAGLGALTYNGTLVVSNLGGTFAAGQSYQLFSAASYTGNFAAMNLPALSGLAWNWNPANGTLSVVAGGIATNPTNITATVSEGNLKLSWPADHIGWRLLVQTNNLLAGISSNTTDWGTVAGSTDTNQVSIPIDVTKPSEFYRLVYP